MMNVVLIIVGLFVLLITAMQLYMLYQSKRKRGTDAPVIGGEAGKLIVEGSKTLLYFYGPSCPPCLKMMPIVDHLQKGHTNLFKINVATEFESARRFGVMGTPAFVLVENRKIVEFIFGVQSEERLLSLLK